MSHPECPGQGVSGGEGQRLRREAGPQDPAKNALPRPSDFTLWAMRKPLKVFHRGRRHDQIYVLARLFQPLGEECTGMGRDWLTPEAFPKSNRQDWVAQWREEERAASETAVSLDLWGPRPRWEIQKKSEKLSALPKVV